MPSRPSLHFGTSTSPHHSTNSVNEVISALTRKAGNAHVDYYKSPSNTPRRPSFSMDGLLHPGRDKGKRNDSKDRESGGKEKRLSLSMRGGGGSKAKDDQSTRHAPGSFEVVIESPPLCFYGSSATSTGALLSGRLKLKVDDPTGEVKLTNFTMKLRCAITTKKPIQKDCNECKERYDDIREWSFLSEPKTFQKEHDNDFPFSHLLPGHLPATTSATLGSVTYHLYVTATASTGDPIELSYPLKVQRAIAPGMDKTSIRIFPPTNLTGRVVLPPVIHPIGTFPVQMTLSGVVEKKADHTARWRLRKTMWRIEEHTKMVSKPCSKHEHKVAEGKAVQSEDVKNVGEDEFKGGWKTDFDTQGGEIVLEFDAALSTRNSHKAVCDVDSPAGLVVNHTLVIELIVAEEYCSNKNKAVITPTGAARILRMSFRLVVTERAGMGISWDEETPPLYENVPDSPPGYGSADRNDGAFGGAIMEDYIGPALEYVDLERLPSHNPDDPPTYRERGPSPETARAGPSVPRARRRYADFDENPSQIIGERYRGARWTEDELGAEPPQLFPRGREGSETQQLDVDDGTASAAPPAAITARNGG
jgi:arrestin-related trafficking adapter 1